MIPEYWKKFIEENDLVGRAFEISEEDDLSGMGAEFQIMKPEDTIDEAENFYPGLIVKKDGFLPVGGCVIGSGDPYFINTREGRNGSLYRIYHDSVMDENYDGDEAVVVVFERYEDLMTKGTQPSG